MAQNEEELNENDRFIRDALGRIAYLLNKDDDEPPPPPLRQKKVQNIGVCETCYAPVKETDKHYNADGNLYHENCFRCGFCDELITGKYFLIEGNLYCETDFVDLHNPLCDDKNCARRINEQIVKTDIGNFHVGCFKCSKCGETLGQLDKDGKKLINQRFMTRKNKLFCIKHAVDLDGRYCFLCDKIIFEKNAYETITRRGELLDLHVECFKCDECGIRIDDQDEISYHLDLKKQKVYCAEHGGMICKLCESPIPNAQGFNKINADKYHTYCTPSCVKCHKMISSTCHTSTKGLVCNDCVKEDVAEQIADAWSATSVN